MTPTLRDERTTLRWRARAFVRQPLVTTIIGVVVNVVLYVVAYNVVAGTQCDPTLNAETRGYCEIFATVVTLPVLLTGVLITGLVVGLGSHDSGPARRAVLAGVMVSMLIVGLALVPTGIMVVKGRDHLGPTVASLVIGAVVGLVLLIPAALGFGEGRRLRRNRQ